MRASIDRSSYRHDQWDRESNAIYVAGKGPNNVFVGAHSYSQPQCIKLVRAHETAIEMR